MAKKEMIAISENIEIAKNDVIETFSNKESLKPFLDIIAKEVTVDESQINLITDKGRKEIGSRAHKVSKIKTALVKAGKDSIADLKAQVAAVNSGVNFITEELDTLRDETRKPLTDWEAEQKRIEEERVAKIKAEIQNIESLGRVNGEESIEDLSALIEAVDNIDVSEGFGEFTQDAMKAIVATKDALSSAMQKQIELKQQEAMQEQLEAQRITNLINDRLHTLRMIPLEFTGKSSAEILAKLDSLKKFVVPESEFGARTAEAEQAKDMVITQMQMMYDQALIVEEAQAQKAQQQTIIVDQDTADQEMAAAAHESMEPPAERTVKSASKFAEASFEHQEITYHLFNNFGITMALAEAIATAIESGEVPFVSITTQQSKVA